MRRLAGILVAVALGRVSCRDAAGGRHLQAVRAAAPRSNAAHVPVPLDRAGAVPAR